MTISEPAFMVTSTGARAAHPASDAALREKQKVAAHYSRDADECRMFLQMLGLIPTPKVEKPAEEKADDRRPKTSNTGRCGKCGCATYSDVEWREFGGAKPTGARVYGGRGLCNSCHRAVLREALPKTDLIDAAETIEHIRALRAANVPWKRIDKLAEVLEGTAHRLVYRRQGRVKAGIASAILAIPVPQEVAA